MIKDHSHKITQAHLSKKAIVYVRQSSEKQVQKNRESQRLQYALTQRAQELGWKQIEVIDEDLGVSAAIASRRIGFERMLSGVTLGQVGIIFSIEASRLSRTDKDWCRLLEVCGLFDILIADGVNIYNLKNPDDQLLLGIKGTISVMELTILKQRMLKGQEEKAKRGELQKLLTPGYIYDRSGRAVKDPDQRVQEAIALVFRKFRQMSSIRQLFKWFHDEGIELPVNKFSQIVRGKRGVEWQLPTLSFLSGILRNPFYAGAYAYGRRVREIVCTDGEIVKRMSRLLPMEEWKVLIKGHHEGYISWDEFEENVRLIRRNCLNLKGDEAIGAIRTGQGLLAGLLRCGHCGKKIHVRYRGKNGTHARYLCKGDFDSGGSYCIGFGGATVDKRFGEEFVKVITPLTLEASIKAIEELESGHEQRRGILEKQLQQLEYESQRAFEQYNEVDPRNRLVAFELERRWNKKLEEVEALRREIEGMNSPKDTLTDEDKEKIMSIGERFEEIWEDKGCPVDLKKKLIRAIIEELIVHLDKERGLMRFVIHWKGGTHTQFEMERPKSPVGKKTSIEDLDIIRKMTPRYKDEEIAQVLNRTGSRTAKGNRWSGSRVKTIRVRNHIERVSCQQDGQILTMGEAARYSKVSSKTIRKLAGCGLLSYEQIVPYAPWEIRKKDLDSEPLRSILDHLKKTGKLILKGVCPKKQMELLQKNQYCNKGGHYEC
jgi:DNA invertase Pin-like site-specific DNA recombinase